MGQNRSFSVVCGQSEPLFHLPDGLLCVQQGRLCVLVIWMSCCCSSWRLFRRRHFMMMIIVMMQLANGLEADRSNFSATKRYLSTDKQSRKQHSNLGRYALSGRIGHNHWICLLSQRDSQVCSLSFSLYFNLPTQNLS